MLADQSRLIAVTFIHYGLPDIKIRPRMSCTVEGTVTILLIANCMFIQFVTRAKLISE
jgi:hypothetical protein